MSLLNSEIKSIASGSSEPKLSIATGVKVVCHHLGAAEPIGANQMALELIIIIIIIIIFFFYFNFLFNKRK